MVVLDLTKTLKTLYTSKVQVAEVVCDTDVSCVKRIRWREGRALQILHVGPYDTAKSSYEKLGAYGEAHKLAVGCPAHEIYLNDPRRMPPEKLKTIVRLSVTKGG